MKRTGYFNGEIGNLDTMTIPLCDRSVFYGDAVYDAILVLDSKPFTLDMHLDRLYRSCELVGIEFNMTRETLKAEIDRLLCTPCDREAMLYIQVTRGNAPRKHEFPLDTKPNLIMYISPITLPGKDKRATLASIEDMRFEYCNIKTTNLMPNVFAAQRATSLGATEALMHRGERVTEAAHSSILMIKEGKIIMPPLDRFILPGITRAIITELCDKEGIPTEERVFTVSELMDADEIILCSTTKNVIFVYEIDGKAVGGKAQALAKKIQDMFFDKIYEETGVRL
ncbi:MAG: aminotransferase class IV [Clostridia bacterium]|nr:aminotransferase class IV [Clostridia bacterium]